MPESNLAPEVEATAASAVVTLAAPPAGKALLITELIADLSATPTAACTLTVSDARTDAGCTTVTTTSLVLDAAIQASDAGRSVTGTGMPANATVGQVVPGVSFVIEVAGVATVATASGSQSLTIVANFLFRVDITVAGETAPPLGVGVQVPPATAVVCTLTSGGAAIVGRLNVGYEIVSV